MVVTPLKPTEKQRIVKQYAKDFHLKVLVETGTYLGQMVFATKDNFKRIYSIELDDKLFKDAEAKFKTHDHILIFHGDSAKALPFILNLCQGDDILFWLDGHYSGGITARGYTDTPIKLELSAIMNWKVTPGSVILIDDARMFNGTKDYPTIEEVMAKVSSKFSHFSIVDDIIRIHNEQPKTERAMIWQHSTTLH